MELLKFKRSILHLKQYVGTNTSMVTVTIRPDYTIHMIIQKLQEEMGKTDNIKDRGNGNNVKQALGSAVEKLLAYSAKCPKTKENGLCVFSGICITADGKTKQISQIVEPFKPVEQLFRCDKFFHVDALLDQLDQDDNLYGYLIVNGDGYMMASVSGNKKDILHSDTISLPKKHNKGGQSSVRFARIAEEKRTNYVRKICEDFNRIFLQKNYKGIVVAGNGNFKNRVAESDLIDYRLKNKIVKILDVPYGFNNGFQQAIEDSKDILSHLQLTQENNELAEYFGEINKNNNKIIYGLTTTFNYLKNNLLEKIIINQDYEAIIYKDHNNNLSLYKHNDVNEEIHIIDYLLELDNGTKVIFISDKTPNGSIFCKGFGGIGGISRYEVVLEDDDSLVNNQGIKLNDQINNQVNNKKIEEEELFI